MAYTAEQRTTAARELARAGGNLSAALKRLRDEYETFRTISENTLRRMARTDGFSALVAVEAKRLEEARCEGITQAERDRARREAEGTITSQLARDEAILNALRERVFAEIAKPEFDTREATRLYADMTRVHDRRREALIPALAETRQGTALVEAVMEAAVALLGQGKAKELMARVKELYTAKSEAQQQEEPQANG